MRAGADPPPQARAADRICGCMAALALGDDALGESVEFAGREEIEARFGPGGVRSLEPWGSLSAAASHGGDSDSTACIAGAIAGARLGLGAIPPEWSRRLEDRDAILDLADRLAALREGDLPAPTSCAEAG